MKPLYLNAIFDNFRTFIKDKPIEFELFCCKNDLEVNQLWKRIDNGEVTYPIVYVTAWKFEYIKDRLVSDYWVTNSDNNRKLRHYEYGHALPMELYPQFYILSTDISQLALLEEYILSIYKHERYVPIQHPIIQNENICFNVSVKSECSIERTQGNRRGKHIYQSCIHMISECPSFTEEYPPARLELDQSAKPEIIERLAALEDIKGILGGQSNAINDEKIESIDQAWKSLDKLVNCLHGITTYHELWSVIEKNNYCSLEKALEIIKEKRQKEKTFERDVKAKIRQLLPLGGEDDELLNCYVDAVIADIRNKLPNPPTIINIGRSELAEWLKLYDEKDYPDPSILVSVSMNYTFNVKAYTNSDVNNREIFHGYSTTALPIEFGVRIDIITEAEESAHMLEKQLREIYGSSPVTIAVPDSQYQGENCLLKMFMTGEASSDKSHYLTWNHKTHQITLYSTKYPTVYYVNDSIKYDITDNHKLQLRLLQQAQFALLCSAKLQNEAIKQLDGDYKNLIMRKSSLFGFLYSAEYKRLKSCFDCGQPIDRSLFNSVLNRITNLYPCLYDKMMSGMSYEQIKADIMNYAEYFAQRWIWLCNLLSLPEHLGLNTRCINRSDNIRSNEGLSHCIDYMAQSVGSGTKRDNRTVKGAIEDYRRFLEIELDDYYEEQERRREYREEYGESSSVGGSLLGSFISQKVESSNIRKNAGKRGKRDLIGQAGCAKTQGGTCSNCNLRFSCSRYFF